jgi:hypothetical protein
LRYPIWFPGDHSDEKYFFNGGKLVKYWSLNETVIVDCAMKDIGKYL